MRRERPPCWPGLARVISRRLRQLCRGLSAARLLQVLESELQLDDRRVELHRRAAELQPAQLGQLCPEQRNPRLLPIELSLLAHDGRRLCRDQRAHLVGQDGEVDRHDVIMTRAARAVQPAIHAISPFPVATSTPASANRFLEQHRQLSRRQRHRAVPRLRPDEPAALEALGIEHQVLGVPEQAFEQVTPLAAEHEQVATERIELQHLLNLAGEPVEATAQVSFALVRPGPTIALTYRTSVPMHRWLHR